MDTALRETQQSFHVSQSLALQSRVIMLRKHNGGRHFLHGPNEVKASVREEVSPAFHTPHLPLHSLLRGVLGLCQAISLGYALQRAPNLPSIHTSLSQHTPKGVEGLTMVCKVRRARMRLSEGESKIRRKLLARSTERSLRTTSLPSNM